MGKCEKKVERGRPQMTIWYMRITCWITRATNTLSEYVILLLFYHNNGCTNTPQCYVIRRLYCLSCLFLSRFTLNYHYMQDKTLSIPKGRCKNNIFTPENIVIRQFISESLLCLLRRKLNMFLYLSVGPKIGLDEVVKTEVPALWGGRAVLQPVSRY